MVIHDIHYDTQSTLMEGFYHLFKFFYSHFSVFRVCGVGALGEKQRDVDLFAGVCDGGARLDEKEETGKTEIDMRTGTTFRPFEPSTGREGSTGSFAGGTRVSARVGRGESGCIGLAPWATGRGSG